MSVQVSRLQVGLWLNVNGWISKMQYPYATKSAPRAGTGFGGLPNKAIDETVSVGKSAPTVEAQRVINSATNYQIAWSGATVITANPLVFANGKMVVRAKNNVDYKYYVYDYDSLGNLTNEVVSAITQTDSFNTTNAYQERFQFQINSNQIVLLGANFTFWIYTITGTTLTAASFIIPNTGTYTIGGGTWTSFSCKNCIIKDNLIWVYGVDNNGYLVCHKYSYDFSLVSSIKTNNIAMDATSTLDVFVDDNFIILTIVSAQYSQTSSVTVHTTNNDHVRISGTSASVTGNTGATLTKAFTYYKDGFLSTIFANNYTGYGGGTCHIPFKITSNGVVTPAFSNFTFSGTSAMGNAAIGFSSYVPITISQADQVCGIFGVNEYLNSYNPPGMSNYYDGKSLTPSMSAVGPSNLENACGGLRFRQVELSPSNLLSPYPISIYPKSRDIISGSVSYQYDGTCKFPHIVGGFVVSAPPSAANNIKFSIGVLS